jgi:ABC-type polar amino acid transport system ATPase subunit
MIIASNVSKRFGKLKVLDDVSVTCGKGEVAQALNLSCLVADVGSGGGECAFAADITCVIVQQAHW